VWFTTEFQSQLAVQPFEAVRLRALQRRADVPERVDHRADLGVGDQTRRWCAINLGPRGRPLGLGVVDRIYKCTRVDPGRDRVLKTVSGSSRLL
jgi:hypothetical protein